MNKIYNDLCASRASPIVADNIIRTHSSRSFGSSFCGTLHHSKKKEHTRGNLPNQYTVHPTDQQQR
jgi:hypothetical protein